MISQNRAGREASDDRRQQWQTVKKEDRQTKSCSSSRARSSTSRRRFTQSRLRDRRVKRGDFSAAGARVSQPRFSHPPTARERPRRQRKPTGWHWRGIALRHRASQIPRKEMRWTTTASERTTLAPPHWSLEPRRLVGPLHRQDDVGPAPGSVPLRPVRRLVRGRAERDDDRAERSTLTASSYPECEARRASAVVRLLRRR